MHDRYTNEQEPIDQSERVGTVPGESGLDVPVKEESQLASLSVCGLIICPAGCPHLI